MEIDLTDLTQTVVDERDKQEQHSSSSAAAQSESYPKYRAQMVLCRMSEFRGPSMLGAQPVIKHDF